MGNLEMMGQQPVVLLVALFEPGGAVGTWGGIWLRLRAPVDALPPALDDDTPTASRRAPPLALGYATAILRSSLSGKRYSICLAVALATVSPQYLATTFNDISMPADIPAEVNKAPSST